MLQQTFFLLLNVSFPPCFLSPLLLSLSFFFFFFFKGGACRKRPRLNPPLTLNNLLKWKSYWNLFGLIEFASDCRNTLIKLSVSMTDKNIWFSETLHLYFFVMFIPPIRTTFGAVAFFDQAFVFDKSWQGEFVFIMCVLEGEYFVFICIFLYMFISPYYTCIWSLNYKV